MGIEHDCVFREEFDWDCIAGMSLQDYNRCVWRLDVLLESRTRECPFCGSSDLIRKGHSPAGLQKYTCKGCGRGFIGNVFPFTHVCIEKWMMFSRAFLGGYSIRRCAKVCCVCLKTAQYMKDRIVSMMRGDISLPVTFLGEMHMGA